MGTSRPGRWSVIAKAGDAIFWISILIGLWAMAIVVAFSFFPFGLIILAAVFGLTLKIIGEA